MVYKLIFEGFDDVIYLKTNMCRIDLIEVIYSYICKADKADECFGLTNKQLAEVVSCFDGIDIVNDKECKNCVIIDIYKLWESNCGRKINGIFMYDYYVDKYQNEKAETMLKQIIGIRKEAE